MKKSLIALAAMAAAGAAHAQSSVTLYGLADVAVRYGTHAAASNSDTQRSYNAGVGSKSNLSMINGGMSGSRWGIRVTEDLGGGMKAIANVEQRFSIDTGTSTVASGDGSTFRQAWVGLSTKAGDITFGRQYSVIEDAVLGNYASFGNVGSYQPDVNFYTLGNSLIGSTTNGDGRFVSNAIKYNANFSGFKVSSIYGLGEQASDNNGNVYGRGSTLGLRLGYQVAGLNIDTAIQQFTTANAAGAQGSNNKSRIYTAGATYTTGPVKFNAGWIGRSIAGSVANPTLAAGVVSQAFTPDASNQKHVNANLYFGGLMYSITPAFTLGTQVWYTKSDEVRENRTTQAALLATYDMSKRTNLYVESDYMLRAPKDDLGITYKKPFGFMAGLRHKF